MGRIRIGTSGWHYAHWRGPFYPAEMPPARFLEFYVERFGTVEINNSFYKLPERSTFEAWRAAVPRDFVFAVKASRFITHMKKLKDAGGSFDKFFERVSALEEKLGPVLFQLPPRWGCDPERLDAFLAGLPRGLRYAFELRDPSWFCPEIEVVLRRHGAGFCIYEFEGRLSPRVVTADFVYVRLHGPEGRYQGSYTRHVLSDWAQAFRNWAAEGLDVYCYFDNDQGGFAAANASELAALLRS